jgi:hypothetical protein
MSYTEYMRRKDAAAIKIVNTRENTDASTHTWKVKMASSTVFFPDGSGIGVMNRPQDLKDDNLKQVLSYRKHAGGRTPDASQFSQCLAGRALADSLTLANAKSTPTIVVGPCYPDNGPTVPALTGSDFVRQGLACQLANGQPHNASTVTPPVFVDDTVRLSMGIIPGGTGCCWPTANHTIKHKSTYPIVPNRPSQAGGQYAFIGPSTTSPDDARKVGAALRNIPYVEKHHGNDLGVNPKRPFVRYQIPAGSPAHLKINDTLHYPVA